MRTLKRKVGWIVTIADEDELTFAEGTVRIVPFHKFEPEATLNFGIMGAVPGAWTQGASRLRRDRFNLIGVMPAEGVNEVL